MAQSLQFTVAHTTLSVLDNVNNNQFKFTGSVAFTMINIGSTNAEYCLYSAGTQFKFKQADIHKIAGSDPSGTPATDYASIAALLPLYT